MVIRRVQLLPWSDRFFSSGNITLTPTSEEEGRFNHVLFVEFETFCYKAKRNTYCNTTAVLRIRWKSNATRFRPITTDETFVRTNLLLFIDVLFQIQKAYLLLCIHCNTTVVYEYIENQMWFFSVLYLIALFV